MKIWSSHNPRKSCFVLISVIILVLLVATTTTFARNLRCPGNLNPHEVVANSYDKTKFFMCTEDGMLEEKDCAVGQEFDSNLLVGG